MEENRNEYEVDKTENSHQSDNAHSTNISDNTSKKSTQPSKKNLIIGVCAGIVTVIIAVVIIILTNSKCSHSFGEWITQKDATCTADGTKVHICSECSFSETEVIEAYGHTTTNGKCSRCNQQIGNNNSNNNSNNNVSGHTHSYDGWETIVNATCTQKGEKQRSCSCGDIQKQDIPALGHTEVIDQAVAATCTTTGFTQGKHCSVCNTVIVAQQIIQASHSEVIDQAVTATCTKEGKTEGKHCSECGTVIQAQAPVAKIEHNYSNGKCTMCFADQPIVTKYLTFGDTASFQYQVGSDSGDFTVSIGSSYTKVTYTANKYNWVYGQQFIRIPIQITNNGDNTNSLRMNLIKLYDSNNNSNNPENGIYSNHIISDNTFNDGHIFDDIRPHSTYSGAIYIPYTGAGTYALVITDSKTFDYIFEFTIQ